MSDVNTFREFYFSPKKYDEGIRTSDEFGWLIDNFFTPRRSGQSESLLLNVSPSSSSNRKSSHPFADFSFSESELEKLLEEQENKDLETRIKLDKKEKREKSPISKPHNFIILGKPGIGKSAFANNLAVYTNSVILTPTILIEEYIHKKKESGEAFLEKNEILKVLYDGGCVSIKFIIFLLEKRISEDAEFFQRGYILDGFPVLESSSDDISIKEQMNAIKNLKYPPDFAFCLFMSDLEIYKRKLEQKYDPETDQVYIKQHYSQKAHLDVAKKDSNQSVIMSQSKSQLLSSKGTVTIENIQDLQDNEDFPSLPLEILIRLGTRINEDSPKRLKEYLEKYRTSALPFIQNLVDELQIGKVFELDSGADPPSILLKRAIEILEGIQWTVLPEYKFKGTSISSNPTPRTEFSELEYSEREQPKFPRDNNYKKEGLSPAGYLIVSGVTQAITDCLIKLVEERPKYPNLNAKESAILFLAFMLKEKASENEELRKKYSKAIDKMLSANSEGKEILKEMDKYHGKNTGNFGNSNEIRKRIEKYVNSDISDLPNGFIEDLTLPFLFQDDICPPTPIKNNFCNNF